MSVCGKVTLLYNKLAEDATGWKIIDPPGNEGLRQRGRTRGHHEPKMIFAGLLRAWLLPAICIPKPKAAGKGRQKRHAAQICRRL